MDDLLAIVGQPLAFELRWLRAAASLGEEHDLTFYDAAWAAAAQDLNLALVSADEQLLDAGLAESATHAASRLGLLP